MKETEGREIAGPREVVTHALAIEARNALARVELSVGELSGAGQSPRILEIASTLQEAVDEMEQLLGTIGRLHAPLRPPGGPSLPLAPILDVAIGRAAKVARSRGVVWAVDASAVPAVETQVPRAVLERLLLAFFRNVFGVCERGTTLSLRATLVGPDLEVDVARTHSGSSASQIARREQVDLEAQLAEWGGSFSTEAHGARYGIRLPLEHANA